MQMSFYGSKNPGSSILYQRECAHMDITTLSQTQAATKLNTSQAATESTTTKATRYLWAITRLCMGWVFLWPFLDKTFGLGHETTVAHAWIHGGSPSLGFLSGSVGPFAGFYQAIAGAGLVNWLFMIGLLGIAVALLLGIGIRIAAVSGAVMAILMWSASLPPQDDIFMDNHIIYALVLIGLALVAAGNTFGLGRWWAQTSLVRRFPWLT
jgi:thiosulfate dehydrogenase [quinone] large subunit